MDGWLMTALRAEWSRLLKDWRREHGPALILICKWGEWIRAAEED